MAENVYVSGYLTVSRIGTGVVNEISEWCHGNSLDPGTVFPSARTVVSGTADIPEKVIAYYGDDISDDVLGGFSGNDVSEKLMSFLQDFCKGMEKKKTVVSGNLSVNGYEAGEIDIFENDVIFSPDDGTDTQGWISDRLEWEYRRCIRAYFADKTEEGRIDKSARMEEAGRVLAMVAGCSDEYISQIYDEEYRHYYN